MSTETEKQKYIAYYRVSTDKQGIRGLGMESQRKMVVDYVESVNGVLINTFEEVISGKRGDRKGILAAIAECKKTGAILAVSKLDRLSREVFFVAQLFKSKTKFVTVDSPQMDKTVIYMHAVLAEWEAHCISTRIKATLAILKERGVKLGNPKLEILNAKKKQIAQEYFTGIWPIMNELIDKEFSVRKIAKELTRRKVKTPMGFEKWDISQTWRILARMKNQELCKI